MKFICDGCEQMKGSGDRMVERDYLGPGFNCICDDCLRQFREYKMFKDWENAS